MKKLENNDFLEELEKLPSAQLSQMLHQELERSHIDKVLILRILHILERRDSAQSHTYSPEVLAAWTSYQAACADPDDVPAYPRKKRTAQRWLSVAAVAAVIACVITVFVPKAEGAGNLFEAIGKWTRDLFSFFSEESQRDYTFVTDNPDLQKVYDAVAAQGVTSPAVPTWIPNGYELTELRVAPAPGGNKIYARFVCGDEYILFSYEFHGEMATNKYAKDDAEVDIYESGGVRHFLMCNEERWVAAWTVDELECAIGTGIEREELCQIIDSIYRR